VLTVTSSLGDSCIDDDNSCVWNMPIIYYLMLYIIYVTLIMRLWDIYNLVAILMEFDMDSLLLFPPYFRRCFRLVINQSVRSCREKLMPEVGVVYPLFAIKGYPFYTKYVIFMHCLLILPLICSYMWDLPFKIRIWCISDFVLKIGYYTPLFLKYFCTATCIIWI